jgi:hypothetical protein
MKTLVSFTLMFVLAVACKEPSVTPSSDNNPTAIEVRWNVVHDFYYAGVGLNNHSVDYFGVPGDYYDFRANGTLYRKESTTYDTLTYKIISDTLITIGSQQFTIQGLTSGTVTLSQPEILTPGGVFQRIVHLSR